MEPNQNKVEEEVLQAGPASESKQNNFLRENPKLVSYAGYIFPFLFFLPLVIKDLKGNQFALFHANQQLILFIVSVGLHMLSSAIYSMLMMSFINLSPFINFAIFVFAILGVVNVSKGLQKELPLIGQFRIL